MRKQPFFRPEYLPHDQSDLNSVYNYLRTRINTMIRSSLEYPAILPEITPNYLKYAEIIYRCFATENYTENNWKKLESHICKLIEERTRDNRKQTFELSNLTQKTLELEEKIEKQNKEDPKLRELRLDHMNLNYQIEQIMNRKKTIMKDMNWLNKMKSGMKTDPRVIEIKRRKDELKSIEQTIEELEYADKESLKQMMWNIQKRENEIILLEGQIEAVQSRIDMIAETLPQDNPYFDIDSLTAEELALLEYSSTTDGL